MALDPAELDPAEPGAIEPAADELGAIELDPDEDAAAGALLLELVEPLAAVELLDPQAAATKASTATPATRPVRAAALLLAVPGVVDTRTSSS